MTLRTLPIAVVARETGLSKDLLRKWEIRYGFPQPTRSVSDGREYPFSQVESLRDIQRLIADGTRVSEAISAVVKTGPVVRPTQEDRSAAPATVTACLKAIRAHDASALNALFERNLTSVGLQAYLSETVAPLIVAVGEYWLNGYLRIHEEHFFTASLSAFLSEIRQRFLVSREAPVVLLTTPPGEWHTLGLEMVRTLVTEAGINGVSLGAQTPLAEIAAAVVAHEAHVLMLSFSAAFPPRLLSQTLSELRALLPEELPIWIGGAGTLRVSRLPPGVRSFVDLNDVASALSQWNSEHS